MLLCFGLYLLYSFVICDYGDWLKKQQQWVNFIIGLYKSSLPSSFQNKIVKPKSFH